ncbi:MAG TPA: hypothetical protein VL442_22935 [Mucilaginibacter sp.]|nr:hypothetical protein [Mucilaginibacter sp.]
MLKRYKNQLFQFLLNHPLGVDNFEVKEVNGIFYIRYLKTKPISFFSISKGADYSYLWPSATVFGNSIKELTNSAVPFEKVFELFKIWIDTVLPEIIEEENEIDLWEEYKKRISIKPLISEDYKDFSVFTKDEKEVIKLGLNEIKLLINQRFTESIEQQQIVENRINYLAESLTRIENKTDWKGILINTIISMSIALSLDSQKGQELYNLFVHILQTIPYLH